MHTSTEGMPAGTGTRSTTCLATWLAATIMLADASPVRAGSTEEQKANCEEAAIRYAEIYGKPPGSESTPVVMMFKHTFCPLSIEVKRGTTVRFVNIDKRTSHSFWFKDAGQPESDRFFGGEIVEMRVDLPPGEHTYLCGPHWQQEGMIGKLIVTP